MNHVIDFMNATSLTFVALVLVVLGVPGLAYVVRQSFRQAKETQQLFHQEKQQVAANSHQEKMAQIRSEDPKLIEGTSRKVR